MPEQSPQTPSPSAAAENASWFGRHKVLAGVGAGVLWSVILVVGVNAANADPPKPAVAAAAPTIRPTATIDEPDAAPDPAALAAATAAAPASVQEYRAEVAKAAAAAGRRTMIGDNTSCRSIDAEAVRISKKTTFDVKLVAVRSPRIVVDHRNTFTKPTGRNSSLVLSCEGTGVLSTGDTQALLVTLSVDSDGETFVDYRGW